MNKDLLEIINKALDKQGISARQASILATGTPELIRNMRRGSIPSVERFRALCDVLKLEFYVGPMRPQSLASTDTSNEKEAMTSMLQEIISRLPPQRKTAEPIMSYEIPKLDNVYQIPVFEMGVAINETSIRKNEQIESYMPFQKSWFDEHGLNPEHCVIVQVRDNSMEPTIANRSMVLVDSSRYRRRVGHIYAISIGDYTIIKRLAKSKGRWQLVSDHPKWKSEPCPTSAEIIGEVKWMARTFE